MTVRHAGGDRENPRSASRLTTPGEQRRAPPHPKSLCRRPGYHEAMRLTDEELAVVRSLAMTVPACCASGGDLCPSCRLARDAYELALEVEAHRAGLPPEPVAVLQASKLAEVAVLARELADALRGAPLPARAVVARSMLEEALAGACTVERRSARQLSS